MNAKQKLMAKVNKACTKAIENAKNISVSDDGLEMIACESAAAIKEMAAIIKELATFLLRE